MRKSSVGNARCTHSREDIDNATYILFRVFHEGTVYMQTRLPMKHDFIVLHGCKDLVCKDINFSMKTFNVLTQRRPHSC